MLYTYNIQYYGKHISVIDFLLTTIMSAIGTIKANIIPFTLDNQHLWVQCMNTTLLENWRTYRYVYR